MTVMGLIPARYGSQRIPRKNIADLGGIPLIQWTINAAKASGIFDVLAISTDDSEVAEIAKLNNCLLIERPKELARAETEMLPVVKHARKAVPLAEAIVLLQPTSPFRTAEDVKLSYQQLKTYKADSIVSVVSAPQALAFEVGHAQRLREAKNIVVPNGALYLITTEHLDSGGDWYDGYAYAYVMPKERSIDIDVHFDLEMARLMLAQRAA